MGHVIQKLFHFPTKFVLKPRGMELGKNKKKKLLENLNIYIYRLIEKMWKIDKKISQIGLSSPREPPAT